MIIWATWPCGKQDRLTWTKVGGGAATWGDVLFSKSPRLKNGKPALGYRGVCMLPLQVPRKTQLVPKEMHLGTVLTATP